MRILAVSAVLLLASVSAGQTPTAAADNSPHRQAWMTVNGVRLHYLDWGGSGETILLLAGFGSDAPVFDTLVPKLTDDGIELDASHVMFVGDTQDEVVRRVRQFLIRN